MITFVFSAQQRGIFPIPSITRPFLNYKKKDAGILLQATIRIS